jgi:hypothetical protein
MSCKRKKTPEQSLFDIFDKLEIEEYKKTVLQERYLNVLQNFHTRASRLSCMFYTTRLIVTVGSILVPAFLSIQTCSYEDKMYWLTWTLSLLVTICNGIVTLFKLDKKYFFINTTLEMLHSEGWQYVGLSGRYASKDAVVPPSHDNQFLVFFHMAEKIKMRQVEEEYWKFTDSTGVGNATSHKASSIFSPTPVSYQGLLASLPPEKKSVIDGWLDDMNKSTRGLQRRSPNSDLGIDGRPGSSGIPESPSETPMPMQQTLQASPRYTAAMVQVPSNTMHTSEENERISVPIMSMESN